MQSLFPRLLALAATAVVLQAHGAGIFVVPATDTVDVSAGSYSFELVMDFATSEATLGGGIDFDLRGPIGRAAFTPSAWFLSAADPQLSGWGIVRADNDLEVHFGSFGGLSGRNVVGTLTVDLLATGLAQVVLAPNQFFGGFFSTSGAPQNVAMSGLQLLVVPEPPPAALLAAGAAALLWRVRRQRVAAATAGR